MKYRIYKERRLLKPYKLQIFVAEGWQDCVNIHLLPHDQTCFNVRYFWTKKQALKEILKDCNAEGIRE